MWKNRDAAFAEITEEIAAIFKRDFPPVSSTAPFSNIQDQVDRKRILRYARENWIKPLLDEQWLHGIPLVYPDLHEVPGALADPWLDVMPEKQRSERALLPGTSLLDIYDQADSAFLLLGVPGVGKTTLLLDIMSKLLERAEADASQPIPLFFHFASWSQETRSFAEWLIEELRCKYIVSPVVARQWVHMRQIVPLLDGLDALPVDLLPLCVEMMNAYRREDDAAPMVVCSRSAEYLGQQARLLVRRAVAIQPFTEEQVDLYLASSGELAEQRAVLAQDKALRVFMQLPLFLSILGQADLRSLRGRAADASAGISWRVLFSRYVESVLARHQEIYSPVVTRRTLAWLARQMEAHNQIAFYPWRIQPDWLPDLRSRVLYYACNGLSGAWLSALALGLAGAASGGQFGGIMGALVGTVAGGVGFGFAARRVRPVEMARHSLGKKQARSLLFTFALWFIALLANRSGGLTGMVFSVIIMLSLLPLLIGELLKAQPESSLDTLFTLSFASVLRQSAWRGARASLLSVMSFGLIVFFAQVSGLLQANLLTYSLLALVLGCLIGLISGGLAALQLLGLYRLLRASGSVPPDYLAFFTAAVQKVLLSKVGHGYLFRYPLLQDYFATLSVEHEEMP